ncbi:MAG TPA: GNAT family N-acetyltransferase [Ktedonobacterales bacterium]|nr:GNAT family N-acetyltransferase [Ktedonobacterales bacterium]
MARRDSLQALRIASPAEQARFCAVSSGTTLDPATLTGSGADEHWLLEDSDGAVARCSLWWRSAPPYPEHRVGLVGHFAADDALAGSLLQLACDRLRDVGCTLAVGPMDGSTFNSYRLVTERGAEPAFFLEPDTPPSWPGHFTGNGFMPLAHYYSALQESLDAPYPRISEIARRVQMAGVRVRPLDPTDFERELRRVYPVVAAGFANSVLGSPMSEEAFVAQYRPLETWLAPELVQIAETDERAVGFLLVVPDWLQARRGERIDTAIVKTIAVLPNYIRRGLSILLLERAQERARARGYTRAIHALMHESNVSRRLSAAYHGRIFRRYTLYQKALEVAP